jgi:hypothetical protein
VWKIKNIQEFDPKQGTLEPIVAEVVPSTVKSKDFCVKLEVSLEDKVYPKTYYHHSQDYIQVYETPKKSTNT